MKKYNGPLRPKKMTFHARKAYQVWTNQRERCSRPGHVSYKYYGAKGVQVKYSSRDFVSWYLDQIKVRKFKRPAVGRIDHSGHYEFGNIEMVESGDNTKEMLMRTGGNAVGIPTVLVFPDRAVAFCSTGKAAKYLGMSHASLQERLKRKPFSKKGNKPRKHDCEIMSLETFMGLENSHS